MRDYIINMMEEIAEKLDFTYDQEHIAVYGRRSGFTFFITPAAKNNFLSLDHNLCFSFTVSYHGLKSANAVLLKLHRLKYVTGVRYYQNRIDVIVRYSHRPEADQILSETIDHIIAFLKKWRFANCCLSCRQDVATNHYIIDDIMVGECEDCFQNYHDIKRTADFLHIKHDENLKRGLVGALVGGLIGTLAVIFIGEFSYAYIISGIVMTVTVIKGYELGASQLSRRGLYISGIISAVMIGAAIFTDWLVAIALYFEIGLFANLGSIVEYFFDYVIGSSDFIDNLTESYLFAILFFAIYVFAIRRNKKASLPD